MSEESLEAWEAFALILKRFWEVWDNAQTRARRQRHPAVERDGGRCLVPGCRSAGSGQVQEHHIVFRSAGGALKDLSNLASLCNAHHGPVLHSGIIRCRGAAPDDLVWEMGVAKGLAPFLTYHGDVRTGGAALPEAPVPGAPGQIGIRGTHRHADARGPGTEGSAAPAP